MALRRAVLAILTVCAAVLPASSLVAGGSTDTIRVMSFNIRYGTADDGPNRWELRKDLLIETIRAFDPDLLGLQEVLASQGRELRTAFPSHEFVGVGRDDGAETGEFVPILWRRSAFTKRDVGHFWLSPEPQRPGSVGWDAALTRMATWVRLQPADSARPEFVVINTHFDHRGQQARLESAGQIRRWIESLGQVPVILIGDFNSMPDEPPYAELCESVRGAGRLRDAFTVAPPIELGAGTFHAFHGAADGPRIDWILADRAFQPLHAAIDRTRRDGRYPSDHFAVTAMLRLPAAKQSQFAPATSRPASQPVAADPTRWTAEIQFFAKWDAKNSLPAGAILFVGSSTIVGWETARLLPDWPIINRGFGGAHLSDVNHYYDRIVRPYRPRAIVLYAGDQDTAEGKSPEQVRDDFVGFVRRVRADQPEVPIVFLAIKPSPARWVYWPAMRRANELINQECQNGARLRFLDLGRLLLDESGAPRAEMYVADYLHLSAAAYAAWTEHLKAELKNCVGEK